MITGIDLPWYVSAGVALLLFAAPAGACWLVTSLIGRRTTRP